jgi:hypothetical protein
MAVKNNSLGLLAVCSVLALTCLVASMYLLQMLLPLVNEGRRADAVVVAVDLGVKGTRKAVFRFVTDMGDEVVATDTQDMYFVRLHTGEQVGIIYDPADPTLVTADLGLWVWQGPMIFCTGAIVLVTLGLVLPRMTTRTQ